MKFYAIADKEELGYFYNFEKVGSTIMTSQCLLPTKSMALGYMCGQLTKDRYELVEVTIHNLIEGAYACSYKVIEADWDG